MTSHVPMNGSFLGPYPDFLAAALVLIFSVVLLLGVQISSKVNIAIALLNVFAILFIVSKCIFFFALQIQIVISIVAQP